MAASTALLTIPEASPFASDGLFIRLAREIAMDIQPLDKLLEDLKITPAQWDSIRQNARFQQLVMSELETWSSSLNTAERVRVKSLAMIEEALPEFFQKMHDSRETLSAKTELFKTISKLAGVGDTKNDQSIGERFAITINMGADKQLKIEKDVTPSNPNSGPTMIQPAVTPQVKMAPAFNNDGSLDTL